MERNNSLEKEILKSHDSEQKKIQNNEVKDKINCKLKNVVKKKKISKQNIIKNKAEVNEPIVFEDDLDHPSPLLSDYYEEGKEEIKNEFYHNKLKEKIINNKENASNIPFIENINNKYDKTKNEKMNNEIFIVSKKSKKIDNENFVIQVNINKKDIDEEENKEKIINKANNPIKKINKINNINKEKNQDKTLIKKKTKKLNKIPQIKKLKAKKLSHKIIKKSINLNPPSESLENKDENEINFPKKIVKIKSNNILINNTLENEQLKNNQERIEDINPIFIQSNSKVFQNNNYNNFMKKKIIPNKLDKKSQSFSKISLNKICSSNNSKINNNTINMLEEQEQKILSERSNKEEKLNNMLSPIKIPHKSNINSSKKVKKNISIPIDFAKYQQISNTYRKESSDNLSKNSKFHNAQQNYYEHTCINNTVRINNIHYNNKFFTTMNEQKENIQDNSQYKKHTYENGGKFNNIQTTYVVISKNSNSNVKLIPKNINSIEYNNNRYLNTNQSDLYLNSSRFFSPQKNYSILNTEKKTCNNPNYYQYYSPYTYYSHTPNNHIIKMNKSLNKMNIKKNNTNYYHQNMDIGNYEMNYMNNYDNTFQTKKAQTVASQCRNTNYLLDKSGINSGRRIENFDNYYEYCGE